MDRWAASGCDESGRRTGSAALWSRSLWLASVLALVAGRGMAGESWLEQARAQHLGAGRLDDEELRAFLESWGHHYTAGMPLPLWAARWAEHKLAARRRQESPPDRASGPPADATQGPEVNVSNDPSQIMSEAFIAVDVHNPLRLVAAANHIAGKPQMMFWSHDGGNAWQSVPMPLGAADMHSDPGVAWDSKGVAYGSALGFVGPSTVEIQVVRSTDGGRSWGTGLPIVAHSAPGNDKELIAANAQRGTPCQDLVCVAWDEGVGLRARRPGDPPVPMCKLHVACAVEASGAWNDTVLAGDDLLIGAVPAFGPDGELFVAWHNFRTNTLDFSRSDDCSLGFSAPAPLAATRAAYDLGIPAMCRRKALVYPALDVDRSGGPRRGWVYAVWADAAPGATCPPDVCDPACAADVLFTRSEDGGLTWSVPVPVHADVPGSDQFNPWLAVNDADGSLNVMWIDTRGDPNRRATHVFYRRSPDGGSSWDAEVRVTTAPTDESDLAANGNQFGDYNGIAAFQCGAWPIWTDRRDGRREQIWSAPLATISTTGLPGDIGNSLRGVAGPGRAPTLSWSDLGSSELSYRVYRGAVADFAAVPPTMIGASGGPDALSFRDDRSPSTPGVTFYKVRGVGPCGAEEASWLLPL